jgi:3-oxoacyl-[acyl-carrier protein] reductase
VRLTDRVAIVTGSSQGIGKAFAKGLAAEGAKVVVASFTASRAEATAAEIRAEGYEAMAFAVDVSEEEQCEAMAEAALSQWGRIDILVNNAAMFISAFPRKTFMDLTVEEWDRMMAVNVRGPWLCVRACFPAMKAQGKGKIINVGSSTFFGGSKDFLHYVTSKGATIGFTRQLAREVGDYSICVNTLSPGLTTSEGVGKTYPPDYLEMFAKRRCFKREEAPEDLVGACVFLASDESDFLTGQTLNVDGGDCFD